MSLKKNLIGILLNLIGGSTFVIIPLYWGAKTLCISMAFLLIQSVVYKWNTKDE